MGTDPDHSCCHLLAGQLRSRITHHDFRHVWLQQVVQPGRPGSFPSNVTCKSPRSPWINCRPCSALVSMTAFHHYLADGVHHRNRKSLPCGIHAMPIYWVLVIKGVLSGRSRATKHSTNLLQRGRPFIMCVGFSTKMCGVRVIGIQPRFLPSGFPRRERRKFLNEQTEFGHPYCASGTRMRMPTYI